MEVPAEVTGCLHFGQGAPASAICDCWEGWEDWDWDWDWELEWDGWDDPDLAGSEEE